MFKKFMSKKRNKKRGFTLIELIIVIAIIAILAAIAVPAFGKIREKANVSSDLGTARTIYSVVTAAIADEKILLPADRTTFTYYPLSAVGVAPSGGTAFSVLTETPGVKTPKTYQNYNYFIGLNNNGDVEIVAASGTTAPTSNGDTVYTIYPKGEDRYAQ